MCREYSLSYSGGGNNITPNDRTSKVPHKYIHKWLGGFIEANAAIWYIPLKLTFKSAVCESGEYRMSVTGV